MAALTKPDRFARPVATLATATVKFALLVGRRERLEGGADQHGFRSVFTRVAGGRRTAAVTVQYGPGAECAFGAVAQAYSDNTPLLFLPTGHPLGKNAVAQNFEALRSYRHITDWAVRAERADALPALLHRALTRTRTGARGPVISLARAVHEGRRRAIHLRPRGQGEGQHDGEEQRGSAEELAHGGDSHDW